MNINQRSLFWHWLRKVLQRRLMQEGYVSGCAENAERDRALLNLISTGDFSKVLPLLESGNIPGFK